MKKYTQANLRKLAKTGKAIDLTDTQYKAIDEPYTKIGYAEGPCGCYGLLLKGCNTGNLYVITARTSAIYIY